MLILARNPVPWAGVAPGTPAGLSCPSPVNAYWNSSEIAMSGGTPVNANYIFADDFCRGFAAKANAEGWLIGTSGTRIFTGNYADAGNLQYTAGWGYNIFAASAIPDPAGIPGQAITGRGASYAASHGVQPAVGGDWYADHAWSEGVTEFWMRWDVFYTGVGGTPTSPSGSYSFGAEKVMSFNPPGVDAGIYWGNVHHNLGAGSASSTGSLAWQGGGGTASSTASGFSFESNKWYSIQCHVSLSGNLVELYADDLGADGTSVPSGGTPTLRLQLTGYTFNSSNPAYTTVGRGWAESWANPGSTGTQFRTNYLCLKGSSGPILIRAS